MVDGGSAQALGRAQYLISDRRFRNEKDPDLGKTVVSCMAFAATLTLVGCGGGNSGNTNHDIKAIIEVPNIGNGTNFSFDISGVDSAKGRMRFTDRNNKSVDVIDTKTNSFIKQITGGFHGCNTGPTCVGADSSKSGPDGLNIIPGTNFIVRRRRQLGEDHRHDIGHRGKHDRDRWQLGVACRRRAVTIRTTSSSLIASPEETRRSPPSSTRSRRRSSQRYYSSTPKEMRRRDSKPASTIAQWQAS